MTRRRYPILGPSNVRLTDANIRPLKPVYLRFEILRGRSWSQSQGLGASLGASLGACLGPSLDLVLEHVLDTVWTQSQKLVYLEIFSVKRPYEPISGYNPSNKRQTGLRLTAG